MSTCCLRATLALLSVVSPPAFAQSLNIDLGTQGGSPSSTYAGAAAQPGVWNAIPADAPAQLHALVDLAGQPVAARLSYTDTEATCGIDFSSPSGAVGDDAALLDDHREFKALTNCTAGSLFVEGLEPGIYDVYTYVFESAAPLGAVTKVSTFPGGKAALGQAGGATWSGTHAVGETYTLHTVGTTFGAAIGIFPTNVGSIHWVPLNGIQLVKRESVTTYCTSKVTSCGVAPELSTQAFASLSTPTSPLLVRWGPVPNVSGNLGIMVATTDGPLATPFQNPLGFGWFCITAGPGFVRVLPPKSPSGAGACNGAYEMNFSAFLASGGMPTVDALVAVNGFAQVDAQGWYRDPPSPGGANLTGAVQFTVLP